MVAPEWVVQQLHSARERGATNRAHGIWGRRGRGFANRRPQGAPHGPLHLLLDSTGLELFGKGERNCEKHGRARRSWRKLHTSVDAETGEITACALTGREAANAGQVPILLEQVQGEIASVMADGAYDGEPCTGPSKHAGPRPRRALSSRRAARRFSRPGVVRRGACHSAMAASSSQRVRSPLRFSPASYCGQFRIRYGP
jgi:hypothetical protein